MSHINICGLLVAMLAWAGPVRAVPMAYEFRGLVDWVADPNGVLQGAVHQGTEYSGLFRFDSDVSDLQPDDPTWGDYRGPSFSIAVNLGLYSGDSVGSDQGDEMILVANDTPGGDGLFVAAAIFAIGPELRITGVQVGLSDCAGAAFSSDALPMGPFPLTHFVGSFAGKGDHVGGLGSFEFKGTLTDFTVVPEPAAILLMAFALGLMPRRSILHV